MNENAIAIMETMPTFKSKMLNDATRRIYEAVNNFNATAATTRKEVAVQLHRIEKAKLYKNDGCKSLAEYAARIGLEKSLAHKLENAGRMLDSKVETVKEFAANADYSKLAILASMPESEVEEAIKSGELSTESTQAAVKDWKARKQAEKKPAKVLSKYDVSFALYTNEGRTQYDYDSILLEDVPQFTGAAWGKIKTETATLVIGVTPAGDLIRVISQEKSVVKKEPRPKQRLAVEEFTDEMLAAAMQEYARRQDMERAKQILDGVDNV